MGTVIRKLYERKKSIFQTNSFYHLADNYLGVEGTLKSGDGVEPSGDGGPPLAKKQKVAKEDYRILDYSDAEKYKLDCTDLVGGYSNAYIHHLYDTKEFLGKTILTINNIQMLV